MTRHLLAFARAVLLLALAVAAVAAEVCLLDWLTGRW
jgi:hypothetical protein